MATVEPGTVVAVLDQGELRVPVDALDDADTADGTPFVLERRDDGLLLRPMTTQEEADWEDASEAPREVFYSGEDFIASLRSELHTDDSA